MFLFHIIDDFVLQPICLSKLKQKDWWTNECEKQKIDIAKYKNDYLPALIMHATSWAIMITIPWMLYNLPLSINVILYVTTVNIIIHAITDHYKANLKKINLITDQSIHTFQIFITWLIYVYNTYFNVINL